MEYQIGYILMNVKNWTPLQDEDGQPIVFLDEDMAEEAQAKLDYKTILHPVSVVPVR